MRANCLKRVNIATRYVQTLFMALGFVTAYGIRFSMSIAIVAMTDAKAASSNKIHDWDFYKQSLIVSSFFWGYTVAMIPCGYLASAWSPRKALFWGLGLSGLLHLLMPFVADWADWIGVCCCRLVVGMLQSCLLACIHTLMSQWSPVVERSLLSGIVNCGMSVGSIVATALSGYIATTHLGWQGIFYVFGAMSCCTSLAIFLCVHDSPAEHPRISAEERDFIEAGKTTIKPETAPKPPRDAEKDVIAKQEEVKIDKLKLPWLKILTSVPMWALVIGHSGFAWGNSIFTLQVPLYMKGVLCYDIAEIGLASSLPFISSLLTLFPVSWLADYTIKRGYLGVAGVRRAWNSLGTCVPALALVVICQVDGYDRVWPVALLVLAKGFESCTASGYFVNHIDLSPNYAGTMISMTNCIASVVTMLAPIVAGAIIGDSVDAEPWHAVFYIAAAFMALTNLIFTIFLRAETQEWNDPKDTRKTVVC